MKERPEIAETRIMNRGQYDDPGEIVQRNTPEFLHPLKRSGDVASRMDLANWFIDKDNPLTARVAVNRIWQQFFGVGLVKRLQRILELRGPKSSNVVGLPCRVFCEFRLGCQSSYQTIVMSKVYRQASDISEELFKKDPENRLLARGSRFRMDAEMIRDQIPFTSGTLSEKNVWKECQTSSA